MVLKAPGQPLELEERDVPYPRAGQLLLKVKACAVCRTDLHVADGDLRPCCEQIVPGHEIVGEVAGWAAGVEDFEEGQRVGVGWLGFTCGECEFCKRGEENLCDNAKFTGYQIDGGFAEYTVADARYCFPLPDGYSDAAGSPADVRRADRLPRAENGGPRPGARHLRLWRGGAYRRAGGDA